jgi:hypothetical protein
MHLGRVGTSPLTQSGTDWSKDSWNTEEQMACINFERFGTGTEKTSYFRASLAWDDVEAIIGVFAKMSHPAALRLERARRLADAVEAVAKNSD